MDVDRFLEVMESAGLASALSDMDAAELAPVSTLRRYRGGEVLWRAGAASQGLFVVLEGRVRVLRSRRGRQHLVHVSGPGSTMGEVALFGGTAYPATAVASSDVECLIVPPEPLQTVVHENASLASLLLIRLSRRVEALVDRLDAQILGGVRSRLAAALMALASEGEPHAELGIVVALPAPQAEWAEDLGTVREVLSRELKGLVDEGLIERVGRRRIRIVDCGGLEDVALGGDR